MKSLHSLSKLASLGPPLRRAVGTAPAWEARCLSTSAPAWSGHSKWASIKHDKGKKDVNKGKTRSVVTKDISNAVKIGGPNPGMNPRLALAISIAKKHSVPKIAIDSAIARGQGLSISGLALESVTLEAMVPPSVAIVIEAQTDNKLRLLADLRIIIKNGGGNVTPIGYMFEKKGRIIFEKKEGVGADEVLEPALEADALDVEEDDEGRVIVYTEPAQTKTTAEMLASTLGLEIQESEIIYDPNEDTRVSLDNEEVAVHLDLILTKLHDVSGVQAVYMNSTQGAASDEIWAELQDKIAA